MTRLLLMGLLAVGAAAWAIAQIRWCDPAARRRALFLGLLPLPAVLLLVLGPIGFLRPPYGADGMGLMLDAQNVGVGASVVLALGLLAWLKEARFSVLVLGGMTVFAAIFVAGVNEIIITPS